MARTTFYQSQFIGWPPVNVAEIANPDSRHWEQQFRAARNWLAREIGEDEYREWAEAVWPGKTIDGLTWKQIHTMTNAAYDYAKQDPSATLAEIVTAARRYAPPSMQEIPY